MLVALAIRIDSRLHHRKDLGWEEDAEVSWGYRCLQERSCSASANPAAAADAAAAYGGGVDSCFRLKQRPAIQ